MKTMKALLNSNLFGRRKLLVYKIFLSILEISRCRAQKFSVRRIFKLSLFFNCQLMMMMNLIILLLLRFLLRIRQLYSVLLNADISLFEQLS